MTDRELVLLLLDEVAALANRVCELEGQVDDLDSDLHMLEVENERD